MNGASRSDREIALSAVRERSHSSPRHVLITGGAGFVGSNLAARLLSQGIPVTILDDLSRPGVEHNLAWLRATYPGLLREVIADVRDADAVRSAMRGAESVFHFAAQVAVTTSLGNPVGDFDVNARGTLTVLEAARACADPPLVVFTSTNKVYGALENLTFVRRGDRYEPLDPTVRRLGVDESQVLDFHSPYGCSKGAADQYVLDYARSYDVPTVVFRMSCIYGPRQFGTEDQGWVAHFLISAMAGDPIVIYGDGRQVRDLLFVEDLVDAFCITARRPRAALGRAFNIGGGAARAASLLQVLELIERCDVPRPKLRFDEWRTGDQRYYVSNTGSFERATGWSPRVGVAEGVRRLHEWLRTSEHPALAHISSVAERSRSARSASRNGVEVATREVAP